ncbi:unnamed protein product [Rangifer tarandus platyrhynchus]|uniref:Uncharacterized protein n=1 Tax=Rangifer tarandus platyrhynchus TaxID=3082113 RepID=A0ACB1MJS8_RANTA
MSKKRKALEGGGEPRLPEEEPTAWFEGGSEEQDSFQTSPPSFLSAPNPGKLIPQPTWSIPWSRWDLSPHKPRTLHEKSQDHL